MSVEHLIHFSSIELAPLAAAVLWLAKQQIKTEQRTDKEPSDLDIDLPDGAQDQEYLEILRWAVWQSLMLSQADLAIYLAGADPFAEDQLGRLSLSKSGLAERDKMVFEVYTMWKC